MAKNMTNPSGSVESFLEEHTATTMECFDRIRCSFKILRDWMDLEAAPSACDQTLSIRHAFLAACRTKRSRNWLHRDTRVPPGREQCSLSLSLSLDPPSILLRQPGFLPDSFARIPSEPVNSFATALLSVIR